MSGVERWLAAFALAAALSLAWGAPAASADRPFPPGSLGVEALDSGGQPEDRAGAHPDRFLTTILSPEDENGGTETSRDIFIEFPPGMGGDPLAVPTCPRAALTENIVGGSNCPPETQVGQMVVILGGEELPFPIFNLEPAPGELVAFGIPQVLQVSKITGHLRPGDQGLTMRLLGSPEKTVGAVASMTKLEFWGVPADHQTGTTLPRRPFLTLPTRCDKGPLEIGVRVVTWQRPDDPVVGRADTGHSLRGCDDLAFSPSLAVGLGTPTIDSPTAVNLDLNFAASGDPDRDSAQARDISVDFPAGMALSPGAASRLGICRDAELRLGSSERATCPPSARVGSVEIAAPQLSEPLGGRIYLGEERPGDRFRMFVVAQADGIETKFVGSLRSDPASGRLSAQLTDLPEMSFSRLSMRFEGGPDALLATPLECGPATTTATLTPYTGGPPVSVSDAAAIVGPGGGPCPQAAPFKPTLTVAASSLQAGKPTSFAAILGRSDGEQLSERFGLTFPSGLTASTASVERCPEAAVALLACPAASRVGSAFVEVGSGPTLAGLNGDVYLTGPYRRAPFGFVLAFRAALGPFDFGSFSVRAALRIDALSGRVSVQTDPLPQSFEGVPIRVRTIGLEIDRPGLMRAPTSCEPKLVEATVVSTSGASARPTSQFTPQGCVDLPFRPRVSMALFDRAQLHRGGKPGLRIVMGTPKGNANLRTIEMSLPRALSFDAAALREVCARGEALAGRCPDSARVGEAEARTSLLKKPLKGQIYVVQPRGKGQPDLWVKLAGEGIEVDIRSRSSNDDGRITTRFEELPDMPLSAVTMRFASGKRGVMVLKSGLCADRARALLAPAKFEGQNGALHTTRVRATAPVACGDARSSRRGPAAGGRRAE